MKYLLIAVILMAGISLVFLGLIFFCTRAAKPKKWHELEDPLRSNDTPEPEKKPDSNRVFL